jgi:ABC-type dipeptide/oligopeptide/nickel transport system ATPase subunit
LLDKKKQEREKLGSVNLKADEETNKYETEIKKMEQDRADLVTAIIKLKDSINELNQKGRERLIEAFDKVNRKFNEVYTKLFNGGIAKLELVDSDDPLESGLELLVSPPGKRLQSISLLSGGEQALTALSLIFAVFLTSPAPICILDEVDAPLDDANVTRFCALLDELTKITDTKFVIITHQTQNLVTLASSSGASTSSKIQIGAGLVKKTANIKDNAVKACSPPDNKEIDCNLFPGGLTNNSKPDSNGSSESTNSNFAIPPLKSFVYTSLNFLLTLSKASINLSLPF